MKHKKNYKYLFVGNRRSVLDEMINQNLNIVKVLAMKVGYLAKTVSTLKLNYTITNSKEELLSEIENIDFDILVSNGCQYILPISKMKKAKYINIHPSLLPELKGRDPINGAILFQKNTGATCHIMDDKIDHGDIISQIEIPYTEDLDSSLLYQLCFSAEMLCFRKALEKDFNASKKQTNKQGSYYTYNLNDRIINFSKSNQEIVNQVKAYNTISKGCFVKANNIILKAYDISIIKNPFAQKLYSNMPDLYVILKFESDIIFKKDNELIRLKGIKGELSSVKKESTISSCSAEEIIEGNLE